MPKLIYLNGPTGAGKTTVAGLLLKMWPNKVYYLKVDDFRNGFGNFDFDKKNNQRIVLGITAKILEECLANNLDVILDKNWFSSSKDILFEIAKRYEANICKFMLYTSQEMHIQRVKARSNQSELSPEEMTKVVDCYQRFSNLDRNNSDHIFIDTTGKSPENIAQYIFESVSS